MNFHEDIEISSESTPDTLDDQILETMKNSGVNRLSIGVQDFNDEILQARRREHTGQEAIDAYYRAREQGFDRINIDLIYRLPKQTLNTWSQNLVIIEALRPDYVTLYHLRKEKRTPLGKRDESQFPSKETAIEMYIRGLEFLIDIGYIQISPNQFALPQKNFKQQEGKWSFGNELLGLGVSAYSYFKGYVYRNIGRFGNRTDLERYTSIIESGQLAIETGERLSQIEKMHRAAVFGIKTSGINREDSGINKKLFKERFGCRIEEVLGDVLENLKNKQLVEENDDFIRLTIAGLIIAEEVATMFYSSGIKKRLEEIGEAFGRNGL